jgi:hypothetical protein
MRTETINLKQKGYGQLIGDIDALFGKSPYYMTTAKVLTSEAVLYKIKKEDLLKYLNLNNGQSLRAFYKDA